MSLSLMGLGVPDDLKSEVTVKRPSVASKMRVFRGLFRSEVTRTRSVVDCIAGTL